MPSGSARRSVAANWYHAPMSLNAIVRNARLGKAIVLAVRLGGFLAW